MPRFSLAKCDAVHILFNYRRRINTSYLPLTSNICSYSTTNILWHCHLPLINPFPAPAPPLFVIPSLVFTFSLFRIFSTVFSSIPHNQSYSVTHNSSPFLPHSPHLILAFHFKFVILV
ncbi:hypothetical protein AAHE18_01G013100 [Arachis hypogaea]